ncbi:hypothetical protein [Streptomyces sp. NPDC058385]|uniref:hypothetical protein n=1 Tax=Streptomyces sp. NPDC058385 TaxID=3346473 RepID=UPI0036545B31
MLPAHHPLASNDRIALSSLASEPLVSHPAPVSLRHARPHPCCVPPDQLQSRIPRRSR